MDRIYLPAALKAADLRFDEVFAPPAPGDFGTCIGAIAAFQGIAGTAPAGITGSCGPMESRPADATAGQPAAMHDQTLK